MCVQDLSASSVQVYHRTARGISDYFLLYVMREAPIPRPAEHDCSITIHKLSESLVVVVRLHSSFVAHCWGSGLNWEHWQPRCVGEFSGEFLPAHILSVLFHRRCKTAHWVNKLHPFSPWGEELLSLNTISLSFKFYNHCMSGFQFNCLSSSSARRASRPTSIRRPPGAIPLSGILVRWPVPGKCTRARAISVVSPYDGLVKRWRRRRLGDWLV